VRGLLAAFSILLAAGGAAPSLAQGTPAPAEQPDPERLALATQVIELSFPPEGRHAMFMRTVDTMTAQMRVAIMQGQGLTNMEPGLERILNRYFARMRSETEGLVAGLSTPLFAAMARAYARTFTHNELVEIKAFVATPTGQRYLQQSIEMLADPDVAQANTDYITRVVETLRPMELELRGELMEYLRTRSNRPGSQPPRGTQ
jgi:hypothetical protein